MGNKSALVCFGEILWDVFPDRKVIGGAPLNVALRAHSQGYKTSMISRLGTDALGVEVIECLKKNQFPIQGIQQEGSLPTGEVLVTLDSQGSARYQIMQPVAWDAIACTQEALELSKESEVFVFGSLASRSAQSKATLLQLLEQTTFAVFDVNLRPPFYSEDLLWELFKKSDFVKMNDEELIEITSNRGEDFIDLTHRAQWFLEKENVKGLCITKGAHGALLFWEQKRYEHPGFKVSVADTVGAGDSFLATLIGALLLEQQPPMQALERACAVGAIVASKAGANCKVTETDLKKFL